MIKRIEIFNFQSHKHTVIDFVKGVNIITGSSDSGKTAIIRAMRWVLFNEPSGDAYRSHWGGDTKVILDIDDNRVIRKRTNSSNEYHLNDVKLKAFGQGVPQEIKDTLKVKDINLQSQMDSLFLLSSTSGNVAKYFNTLIDLEIMDQGISNIKSKITSANQTIKVLKQENEISTFRLNRYGNTDNLPILYNNLKLKVDRLKKVEDNCFEIEAELWRVTQIDSFIVEANELISLENKLLKIKNVNSKLDNCNQKGSALLKSLRRVKEIDKSLLYFEAIYKLKTKHDNYLLLCKNKKVLTTTIIHCKQLLKAVKKSREEEKRFQTRITLQPKVTVLSQMYLNRTEVTLKSKQLTTLYTIITNKIKEITSNEKSLLKLEKSFKDNFPDVCPLCGAIQK